MEREILFRGFCPDKNGTRIAVVDGKEYKGNWVEGYSFKIWDKCYILWGTTNDIPNMIEVIPETVGQFTGLIDKNGKKIFEGDILECVSYNEFIQELGHIMQNLRRKFTVEFYKGCFALREDYNDEMPPTYWKEFIDNAEYEVIGTIFEKED